MILYTAAAILLAGCAAGPAPAPSAAPVTEPAVTEASVSPQETVAPSAETKAAEITDASEPIDFSQPENWLYYGTDDTKPAQAFVITATVEYTPAGNVSIKNADTFRREQGFINRIKGMMEDRCSIYAPAYRQMTLDCYVNEKKSDYEAYAYKDISDAFRYWLDHAHQSGTPLILFGFSQGGDMAKKILEEYFSPDTDEAAALHRDLAGAYLLGTGMEKSWYDLHGNLHAAEGKDDTGVIISFDAETPEVHDSLILREGTEYVSINPLNWKTDSTRASKEENPGAVLTNAKGEIKMEEEHFCGGYLDDTPRHALKVDDLEYEKYANTIAYLPVGSYHAYDVTFFYKSIRQNVTDRIDALMKAR